MDFIIFKFSAIIFDSGAITCNDFRIINFSLAVKMSL